MNLTTWVDVAIGLILVYLGASLFVTVLNEYVAQTLNLRGSQLCRSLQVLIDDEDVKKILTEFSALDNVMLPMRRLGKLGEAPARARALQLLDQFGIAEQSAKHPHQFSGGQRHASPSRALATDPLVVLADEPTDNLDSAASANVQQILRELAHEKGQTVVAVTHGAGFAAAADRHRRREDRCEVVGGIEADWRPHSPYVDPAENSGRITTSSLAQFSQFSTLSAGTRLNSAVLSVTQTASRARAWAAISMSFAPIGVPLRSSAVRMAA